MALVDPLLRAARWRWTPFVGPAVGTTLFVLTLAWLVPDDIGSVSHRGARPSVGASLEAGTSADEGDAAVDTASSQPTPMRATQDSPRASASQHQRRRGFSPPIERPDAPAAPPPPPPPQQGPAAPMPPPPGGPGANGAMAVGAAQQPMELPNPGNPGAGEAPPPPAPPVP